MPQFKSSREPAITQIAQQVRYEAEQKRKASLERLVCASLASGKSASEAVETGIEALRLIEASQETK